MALKNSVVEIHDVKKRFPIASKIKIDLLSGTKAYLVAYYLPRYGQSIGRPD